MGKPRLLVVDDEDSIRHVLQRLLEMKGCDVRAAGSAEAALDVLAEWEPEVALLDIVLPGRNGIQLLGDLKAHYGDTEVLMMTSNASADTALQAIRQEAYDYLQKPFSNLNEVWTAVQRAIEKRGLTLTNRALHQKNEQRTRELSTTVSLGAESDSEQTFDSHREILDYFVEMVTKELDVARASVMLTNEATGRLQLAASRGLTPEVDTDTETETGIGTPPRQTVSGNVVRSGEPILVSDVRTDDRAGLFRYPQLSDSFLSVPIVLSMAIKSEQKILGVINVTNRRSGKPFGPDDVSYLTGLAGQLAIAIDETRQSEQLRKAYESLKAAQDQLVCSERIKAVGQMAAGVAHDFNNVLGVILARTEFILNNLRRTTPDLRKIDADLAAIRKTAMQGVEAIKRIQDYTRTRQDVVFAPVDLNDVVRDAIEIARPKWKEESEAHGIHIEVEVELSTLPPVSGNVYELTQVVGNLIFNAVEAMPDGGRLSFRTLAREGWAVLEVRDTGNGMTEETRHRLFEPFFTTKETGQGLGTSILFGIVTRHGGRIDVESEPGRGSTFRVTLPRLESAAAAEGVREAAAPPVVGSARVLLIDDDDLVRETYEEALALGGHVVVSASGGRDALALCAEQSFDLVVTDLSMSGMSGLEVAAEVKRLRAGLPVVLFSGHTLTEQDPKVKQAGVDHVLAKPCSIEDLLEAVQKALRPAVEV